MPESYEEIKDREWKKARAKHELGIYLWRRALRRGCLWLLFLLIAGFAGLLWLAYHWPPR